jgi:phage terminase large subunit GpA-like protein
MIMQPPIEALRRMDAVDAQLRAMWEPPKNITVTGWAEANRIMPKGTTSRPGPWVTESFQREMIDAITNGWCKKVVCKKSTQIGWSDGVLNNVVAYYIDGDPKPMMIVQPTDDTAKKYGMKRIQPMITACPALKAKVKQATARRAGNSLTHKEFDGGFLKIAGANSAASLRSDQIAVLLFDEIDGYPDDVQGEGDPVEIATRRTDQWEDAKIFMGSTPAKPKGISRIEKEYDKSSRGKYYVPCPHCGHEQVLEWEERVPGQDDGEQETVKLRVEWQLDSDGEVLEGSTRYICAGCKQGIDERYKQRMLDAGRWIHQDPKNTTQGFYINAIYSPWKLNWDALAQEWIDAQDNPEKLQAFYNLRLGETWNEGAIDFGEKALAARRECFQPFDTTDPQRVRRTFDVPMACAVLVATADIQHNRIEVQITGFGAGEESWLIAHEIFWGEPGVPADKATGHDVWADFDDFLLKQWRHESGAMMRVAITLVDSGELADEVYDFVVPRQHSARRVYACKGIDYLTKPGLVQEGTTKRHKVRLFVVATYAAKDRIFARLKIPKPKPGYHHLPDWVTDEYLKQLLAEKKIKVRDKRTRRPKVIYVRTHSRNEALDLTVYAHAAMDVLQKIIDPVRYRDLGKLAAKIKERAEVPDIADRPQGRRVRSKGVV